MRIYKKKVPILQCKLSIKEADMLIYLSKRKDDKGVTDLVRFVNNLCLESYKKGLEKKDD